MLGENDGPSMISYATTGATYGLGFFLPFIVVTFGMAIVCQEMCMRVGAVTHRGYGQLVLQRFGPLWGWFAAGDLLFTNLVTMIAEFVAIRVGLAYFHLGPGVASALGLVLVVFTLSGGRYWRWERIALGLAIFNGLFLVAAVMVRPHWGAVAHSLGTFSPLPVGSFNNAPHKAVPFYAANITVALIAALIILIPGAPLLSITLNANVLATVLLPVTLVFMLMLANDRELMGKWVNTSPINTVAIAIVMFVSVCGAGYGIDSFLQTVHLIHS